MTISDMACSECLVSARRKDAKKPINLRLSIVKPLGAKWMSELFDYMKAKPEIICNGFKQSGIFDNAVL